MPAFRRVDARRAGKRALGILVPPGERTLVVVRPRSLPWDLLPARWEGNHETAPTFCLFGRDEAALAAKQLQQFMDRSVGGVNPLETFGAAGTFQIWLRTEEFVWIVCSRSPGQAYTPAIFATLEEAQKIADLLTPLLWPGPDAEQEYYFNTQQFSR